MPYHHNTGTLSGFGNSGQEQPSQSSTSLTNFSNPNTGIITAGRPPGRAYGGNSYGTLNSTQINTVNQASMPDYSGGEQGRPDREAGKPVTTPGYAFPETRLCGNHPHVSVEGNQSGAS